MKADQTKAPFAIQKRVPLESRTTRSEMTVATAMQLVERQTGSFRASPASAPLALSSILRTHSTASVLPVEPRALMGTMKAHPRQSPAEILPYLVVMRQTQIVPPVMGSRLNPRTRVRKS